MPISHHPRATTLHDYANGVLAAGAARVVTVHLEHCRACASAVMPGGSRAKLVSDIRFDAGLPLTRTGTLRGHRQWARALESSRIGPWMWAGFGIRVAHVLGAAGLGEHLYLLKAKAGAKLLQHGHEGPERAIVLRGAFRDGETLYAVGDVAESDHTKFHDLQAAEEGGCICLVATEGSIKISGIGRWVQILLRV